MRRGQILMLLGATMMVVGSFNMGLTLGRATKPKPVVRMDEVNITGSVDAGSFETLAVPVPLPKAPAKAFDPKERRADFKAQMDLLAMDIGIKYGDNVTVENLFFAINNTEKNDAAIVVLKAEKLKETTALFFVFNGTGWQTFPSDFQ